MICNIQSYVSRFLYQYLIYGLTHYYFYSMSSGAVLGAIGIYEPFLEFAGCGASVPLSGFGYNLWKGIKEAVDQDGFIGLFRGGFKMAAVGTSAALIFSYLASLIFKPKMVK